MDMKEGHHLYCTISRGYSNCKFLNIVCSTVALGLRLVQLAMKIPYFPYSGYHTEVLHCTALNYLFSFFLEALLQKVCKSVK